MTDFLAPLNDFAETIGSNLHLVQGAGGNLSLKRDGALWIKASGTWLSEANARMIFVPLDLLQVRQAIARGEENFLPYVTNDSSLRPSIETSLHALFPANIVLHVHSVNALSWAVRKDGKEKLATLFKGLNWGWVEYVRPGLPLTHAIEQVLTETPHLSVMMLANHGLIVTGDTIEAVSTLLAEVERRLAPRTSGSEDTKHSIANTELPAGARLPAKDFVHALAHNPHAGAIAAAGALYPDHAVFLGDHLPVIAVCAENALPSLLAAYPYCAIVEGKGVVLGAECSANAEAMLECLALLAPMLPAREALRFLNVQEINELVNWDAEKIRKQASKKAPKA